MRPRPLVLLAICWLLLLLLADHFSLFPFQPKHFQQPDKDKALFQARVHRSERTQEGAKVIVSEKDSGIYYLLKYDPEIKDIPRAGDELRCFLRLKYPARYKNPGTPDYRRSLERQNIYLQAYVKNEDDCETLETTPPNPFWSFFENSRTHLQKTIEEHFSSRTRSFLKSLVLGDRSEMTSDDWNVFQKTGTTHVIAVSGLHLTLIGGFFYFVFSFIFRFSPKLLLSFSRRRLALLASLAPMTFYVILLGFAPSAWRALFVASLLVLSCWIDRESDPWSLLAAAFLGLTIMQPSLLFGLSFQLSFLAMIGVLAFRRQSLAKGWREALRKALWMTLGASLLTLPLVISRFHFFSLSGIFHNLWAVPFVNIILMVALSLLSFSGIFSWNYFYKGLDWVCELFLKTLEWCSRHSWGVNYYPDFQEVTVLSITLFLILVFLKVRSLRKECLGLFVFISFSFFVWNHYQNNRYEVCFIDVGQGDAAMVRSPNGKTVLIDGGGFLIPGQATRQKSFDIGEVVLTPYLKTKGVGEIDQVILSHPHPDHFGGLKSIIENFPVRKFCSNGEAFPDESFDELKNSLLSHSVSECDLKKDDSWEWEGLKWKVLYPEKVSRARSTNDNSLVIQMIQGDLSFLWTGDVEKEGEAALSDAFGEELGVASTVLKVPHHASKTSSSIPFIDTVKPQYVVASLGENNFFGFPHADILERYERRGAKVLRTDQDGEVCFTWKSRPEKARWKPSERQESPNSIFSIQTFSSSK